MPCLGLDNEIVQAYEVADVMPCPALSGYPRTLLWLFSKSLGGRGEGITIRAILSPRYQWDSRPGLCGPVTCPTLFLFHLNLLKSKAIL
jgi:hypothetical protein